MRRQAFAELYGAQAGQMAERMGRLRQKEANKREAFLKHVERYLPPALLAGMPHLFRLVVATCLVPARSAKHTVGHKTALLLISREVSLQQELLARLDV
jgi:hypothetical protein